MMLVQQFTPNGTQPRLYASRTERRNAMLEQYRTGVPVEDIARAFGVTHHCVRNTANRYGVFRAELAENRQRIAAARAEREARIQQRQEARRARQNEMVEKYQSGIHGEALAIEYGISRERVCQILRPTNVMATAAERRRLAMEALASEAAAIKAAAKADFEKRIAEGVELVRGGKSVTEAVSVVGLNTSSHVALGAAVRQAGIPFPVGRYRDMTARRAAVSALLAKGSSNTEIIRSLRAQGDATANLMWLYRHFPECRRGRPRKAATNVRNKIWSYPPARKAAIPPINPDAVWSDEKVATLRKHWLAGCSAQQIVDIFGGEFTRNAIIGKISRMRAAGQLNPVAVRPSP